MKKILFLLFFALLLKQALAFDCTLGVDCWKVERNGMWFPCKADKDCLNIYTEEDYQRDRSLNCRSFRCMPWAGSNEEGMCVYIADLSKTGQQAGSCASDSCIERRCAGAYCDEKYAPPGTICGEYSFSRDSNPCILYSVPKVCTENGDCLPVSDYSGGSGSGGYGDIPVQYPTGPVEGCDSVEENGCTYEECDGTGRCVKRILDGVVTSRCDDSVLGQPKELCKQHACVSGKCSTINIEADLRCFDFINDCADAFCKDGECKVVSKSDEELAKKGYKRFIATLSCDELTERESAFWTNVLKISSFPKSIFCCGKPRCPPQNFRLPGPFFKSFFEYNCLSKDDCVKEGRRILPDGETRCENSGFGNGEVCCSKLAFEDAQCGNGIVENGEDCERDFDCIDRLGFIGLFTFCDNNCRCAPIPPPPEDDERGRRRVSYHTACFPNNFNGVCLLLPGVGPLECQNIQDCQKNTDEQTHKICQFNPVENEYSCVSVAGSGNDVCSDSLDCSRGAYTKCTTEGDCIWVEKETGNEENECIPFINSPLQCGRSPTEGYHRECDPITGACLYFENEVEGDNSNKCSSSNDCPLPVGFCGDGVIQSNNGEECDLGSRNGRAGERCTSDCKKVDDRTFCGDGVVQNPNDYGESEECDAGSRNGITCTALYGSTCSYCNLNCINVEVRGGRCGDSICDVSERYKDVFCPQDCNYLDGYVFNVLWANANRQKITNANPGDRVNLIASTNFFPGTEIVFEIYEDDLLLDDSIRIGQNALRADVGSDGVAIAEWIISNEDLEKAGDEMSNSYEFYFKASASFNQLTINKESDRLTVGKTIPGGRYCSGDAESGYVCSESGRGRSCNSVLDCSCGDGIRQSANGEECDLGSRNGMPGERCTSDCKRVNGLTFCGDEEIQNPNGYNEPEQCDAGSRNGVACTAPYGGRCTYCSSTCTNIQVSGDYCGDGIRQSANGEECDLGSRNGMPGERCTSDCKRVNGLTFCGDEEIQNPNGYNEPEQCDAGSRNGMPGESCSSTCTNIQVSGNYCGDGIRQSANGEECDLGSRNGMPGERCTSDCKRVNGLTFCGDEEIQNPNGYNEPEQCDAGSRNGMPGESCSSTCTNIQVLGDYCGDGIRQSANGEECDDGNNVDGDGCSAICRNEVNVPEISSAYWENSLGRGIQTALVGDRVYMVIESIRFPLRTDVLFNIFKQGESSPIKTISGYELPSGDLNDIKILKVPWRITLEDFVQAQSGSNVNNLNFVFTAKINLDSNTLFQKTSAPLNVILSPEVSLISPIHRGIYFANTNIEFKAEIPDTSFDYAWTIEEIGTSNPIITRQDENNFVLSFSTPGEKIIQFKVYKDDVVILHKEIAILVIADKGIFAFIEKPRFNEIILSNDFSVDFSAKESFVVKSNAVCNDVGSSISGEVSCLHGNCPQQTENAPSSCTGKLNVRDYDQKNFNELIFNWTFDDGENIYFGKGENGDSGSKTYSSFSRAFNDKKISLELIKPGDVEYLTNNPVSVIFNRNFTLVSSDRRCLDGHFLLEVDSSSGLLDSVVDTLEIPGSCVGADNLLNSQDDCCPSGYLCDILNGEGELGSAQCILTSINECSDYNDASNCSIDPAGVSDISRVPEGEDPSGYLDPLWNTLNCGLSVRDKSGNVQLIGCKCAWLERESRCVLQATNFNSFCINYVELPSEERDISSCTEETQTKEVSIKKCLMPSENTGSNLCPVFDCSDHQNEGYSIDSEGNCCKTETTTILCRKVIFLPFFNDILLLFALFIVLLIYILELISRRK